MLACVPVVASLGPLYTDPGYARSDLRAAAHAVQQQRAANEIVLHLAAFSAAPFDYYGVAQPAAILLTNERQELCAAVRASSGGWLVTAYMPADDDARDAAEAGIIRSGYADGLIVGEPHRFLGVSAFRLGADC
jgi:hypothetical protein